VSDPVCLIDPFIILDPIQGLGKHRLPRNFWDRPTCLHTALATPICRPFPSILSSTGLCILHQIRRLAKKRGVDLTCLCPARCWSRLELLGDTLECKGKGVDHDSEGVYTYDVFLRVKNTNSNNRLAPSPRQTVFASSQLLIADREKSCPLSNAFPRIPPRTRSAINKTPTPCTPLIPSLSDYSLTHRLRTLLSPIIADQ